MISSTWQDDDGTWISSISEDSATFFGHPIAIQIEGSAPGEPPLEIAVSLQQRILSRLPSFIAKAESALEGYMEGTSEDYKSVLENVHIWLMDDDLAPMRWAFVIERSDWECFGWHIEFEDMEFIEIWAGD